MLIAPKCVSGASLWLVGSSIVKRAFIFARQSVEGASLGLQADCWWQGYSGLRLTRTEAKLRTLLQVKEPPSYLMLHVGGNDLGVKPIKELKTILDNIIKFAVSNMPGVILIWSEILPRDWGEGKTGLEAARKRLNTYAAKQFKSQGGFYLRHKNMPFGYDLYAQDGVHLTSLGNRKLLGNLKLGISHFLLGVQPWFA